MTGAEIKDAREARGWSQERLAKSAGISPQLLAEVELGDGRGPKANQVLRALGVYVEQEEQTSADESPYDDCVVLFDQPQTSVYRNKNDGVVIMQTGRFPSENDEEQFVYFSSDESVRRLIQALKREIGDD